MCTLHLRPVSNHGCSAGAPHQIILGVVVHNVQAFKCVLQWVTQPQTQSNSLGAAQRLSPGHTLSLMCLSWLEHISERQKLGAVVRLARTGEKCCFLLMSGAAIDISTAHNTRPRWTLCCC